MHVLVVAGARPNFMKVAPILRALNEREEEVSFLHTGQHYDRQMSDAFFEDLGLPEPDAYLGVGSGSHAEQTAHVMLAFEPILIDKRPDWVVVVGDVNSTLACALVTAKLKEGLGCGLAHVEAGLRSNNWRMPEEANRVLTDRLSDLLFTPSLDAHENLSREGIPDERVKFVGNVMIDTLLNRLTPARALEMPERMGLDRGKYVVVTLHRPSNVDNPDSLSIIIEALSRIAEESPVILPLHPRTEKNIEEFGLAELLNPLTILEPAGYLEMVSLMDGASIVLTDSGGIQEETTVLGIPCVTLREQTERPITLTEGTNHMAPWPVTVEGLLHTYNTTLQKRTDRDSAPRPEGWDGRASERIVDALAGATS